MFATLARTAAADSNVKEVEVKKVQEIMRRVDSNDYSAAVINVAAKSQLFEQMPLQQFVSRAARQLSLDDRREVAQAIAEVCKADGRVSEMEAILKAMVSSLHAARSIFDAAQLALDRGLGPDKVHRFHELSLHRNSPSVP